MKMRTVIVFIALAAAAAVAGCGSGSDDSGFEVAATTGVVADLVENVGGPDVDVTQVVPDSASPHDFQLSVQDRQELEDADQIASVGAGLEAGIPLDDVDAPDWVLTEHVGELRPDDPHVWMDLTRVAAAIPSLAGALAEADPDHAEVYRRRAAEYSDRLERIDTEIRRTLAAVPAADRKLVTSHDSLGYFADHYGFEVIATAFPASGPEAEASAATLAEVEDAVRASDVPAVFAQREDDPEALREVAERTGVAIEDDLIIESPAEAGSYIEMLREDASSIADALSPE
jgi:ABC-type Zn uptake system ZnuABC Zn-binding protein ZnuA